MKTIIAMITLSLLFQSCSKNEVIYSAQKITYRLSVNEMGMKMCYCFDSCTYVVPEPGVYDTSFYRDINETCYFNVTACCKEEQKISFVMQIIRNDMEVKSKSYTRNNVCGDVNLSMSYLILP